MQSKIKIALYRARQVRMYKGPFIRTSAKFLGFWTPSPLVRILARSIRVNPRNLPYYVCFWANPPPPLGADVLYEWSLSLDVGRGPQGLNLIKERRASDAVSGRRVGNGWRRKDGEFSIESRAKSGTPL